MPANGIGAAFPAMLAFACALAITPAAAQSDESQSTIVNADTPANADDPAAAVPSDPAAAPVDDATLADALTFDPSILASANPAKPLHMPGMTEPKGLDVNRTDRPDGSSTVSLKQPLATDWDTQVGADIGLAANPPPTEQPDQPLPVTADNPGSGAAWASVAVPNVASIDARIDQHSDHSKVATTLKRALPIGGKLSVTVQDSYSVTETYGTPSTVPSSLPMMTASTPMTPAPSEFWNNEKLVKLDILPTGTSVAAGLDSSSTDPVTHNIFSADQKIYGPLHVTTSVTDLGQPTSSKSITAGLKLNW